MQEGRQYGRPSSRPGQVQSPILRRDDPETQLRGKCAGSAWRLRVVNGSPAAQTENVAATALASQFKENPAMVPGSTFLAPGQRYAPPGTPTWRLQPQVTVLQVCRDPDGVQHIVHRCPAGRVLVTLAAELEAAVEAGRLVPVAGAGRSHSC